MKKIKIILIMILGLCLFSNNVLAETVIDVEIDPEEPTVASTITLTATITSEKDINKVYMEIQECKEDLCFMEKNLTMTKINNNYKKQYQLERDEATYFKYSISVLFDDGTWYNQSEKTNITLKPVSNNNGTNDGNGENKDSPGFEFVFIIIAISLTILFIRKKRLR